MATSRMYISTSHYELQGVRVRVQVHYFLNLCITLWPCCLFEGGILFDLLIWSHKVTVTHHNLSFSFYYTFVSDSPLLPRCDTEWGGEYCDEPVGALPSQLKDSFSRAPSLTHWHVLTGGKLSTVCGAVASGAALHFSGVNTPFFYHNIFHYELFHNQGFGGREICNEYGMKYSIAFT